jgi:tetratricopeptide (TPR) repeat protein
VLEQMGKAAEAAKALVDYLETYSADGDAWFELARLYLAEGQHRKAAFCYEELLLLAPTNHAFHLKYAEILYTLGTAADLKTARGYFAHALNLCPQNNARALYGLLMVRCAGARRRARASARTRPYARDSTPARRHSPPTRVVVVARALAPRCAQCCQAMGASRAKADAKTVELLAFASQQLKAAYQSNPAQAQLVERMLATMAA